jgi:hypothetical protein
MIQFQGLFSPAVGSVDRARYLQAFYLATSTVDGLVLSGYKESQFAGDEVQHLRVISATVAHPRV